MMIFRLCFCCFGFNRNSPNDSKRLLANQWASNANKQREFYTVHKVTSFGRDVSHDDDGAYSDYEATLSAEKPNLTETVSDLEESIARTPQGSPIVKKRGHWGKALIKTKRETSKSPTSLQTIASVSMMMLPTITVAGSSTSMMGSSEDTTNPGTNTLSKREQEVKSLSSSPQTSGGWLKSQSMLNVTCASDIESDQSSKSTDNVARKYGLDASLYGNTHLSKSMEAVNRAWKSMDDFVNDNGFIDLPNGAIHFIASYSSSTRKLVIQIEKIEGLAPKGVDRSKYDCIVKLTMLPHEKHIKFSKTIPAHSTLHLKECFTFSVKDPLKKVLRISVYDSEFLSKYDAVGHALFYVEDASTHEQKSHALKLYRQSMRENNDLSPCSMPISHNGAYSSVNEQTFHTPSFGDEDFDITPLGPTATPTSNTSQPPSYQHQVPMSNLKSEPMSPSRQELCNTNGYHYMTSPLPPPPSSVHNSHNMGINVSANYTNSHQQPVYSMANNHNPQLLLLQSPHQQSQQSQQLHQQPQQPSHYNVAAMRSYAQSPQANSPNGMASTPGPNPPGGHENTTTSDDSDDSTPHTTLMTGMKRPSPEPIEPDIPKTQKKPKPTKKKKKKDPNEPQKPVSAYALFFRDTQAAIKGQNPNTSFGEVSKIVASMWDSLDVAHKNEYKKKTELAKKDYLKQLAAYRATLVAKPGENDNSGYGNYGGYGGSYSGYSPPAGLPSPPIQSPSPHQQMPHASMNKKSQLIMTDTRLTMNGHQPNMMTPPSHMTASSHIDHQSQQQHQQHQQHQQQQAPPLNTVPQQQSQPLNPSYPHQQQPQWSWCYRMGPPNQ